MMIINRNISSISSQGFKQFFACLILCLGLQSMALSADRTSTATGGNWNSTSTWSGGVRPVAGDNVFIATTGTGAVTVDGVRTCVNLTINSGGRLIIGGVNTLNVTGAINMLRPGNNLESQLNVNGGTLNVTGLTRLRGSTGTTRLTTLNITTGTANLAAFTTAGVASKIIFNGTGTLNLSGTLTGTAHTLTPDFGSVNFTSAAAQNIWTKTYYNLGVSGAGTKTLSGNTTVNNTVTVDGTMSLGGTRTLTLPGTGTPLVVNGVFTPVTGTVLFCGTGAQNVAGTNYYDLTFSNGGTKTFPTGALANVSRDFNVGSPALMAGNSSVDITRNITGAGSLTMTSGTLSIGGNNTRTGTFNSGSGTVHYKGAATQTVRVVEYFNLSLSLAGNKSIPTGENIIINNDLDVNSQLTLPGLATADIGGDVIGTGNIILGTGAINLEGDWMNEGNLSAGIGSTVVYDGTGNQLIGGEDYYNLETAVGGVNSLNANAIVRNTLSVGTLSELDLQSYNLNLSGTGTPLINNGVFTPSTSTVNYTNASQTEIAAVNYYNLNGTGGPRKLAETGTIGISGLFTPGAGSYTVTNSTVSFNGDTDQVIPAFTFNDVIFTGSGERLIDTTVNVKMLTIENGPVLHLNSDGGGELVVTD